MQQYTVPRHTAKHTAKHPERTRPVIQRTPQYNAQYNAPLSPLRYRMRGDGKGLIARGVTEIVGESAAAKTQLCLQLAMTVQLSANVSTAGGGSGGGGRGLDGAAVYVSTEDAFPNKRMQQASRSSATIQSFLYHMGNIARWASRTCPSFSPSLPPCTTPFPLSRSFVYVSYVGLLVCKLVVAPTHDCAVYMLSIVYADVYARELLVTSCTCNPQQMAEHFSEQWGVGAEELTSNVHVAHAGSVDELLRLVSQQVRYEL